MQYQKKGIPQHFEVIFQCQSLVAIRQNELYFPLSFSCYKWASLASFMSSTRLFQRYSFKWMYYRSVTSGWWRNTWKFGTPRYQFKDLKQKFPMSTSEYLGIFFLSISRKQSSVMHHNLVWTSFPYESPNSPWFPSLDSLPWSSVESWWNSAHQVYEPCRHNRFICKASSESLPHLWRTVAETVVSLSSSQLTVVKQNWKRSNIW